MSESPASSEEDLNLSSVITQPMLENGTFPPFLPVLIHSVPSPCRVTSFINPVSLKLSNNDLVMLKPAEMVSLARVSLGTLTVTSISKASSCHVYFGGDSLPTQKRGCRRIVRYDNVEYRWWDEGGHNIRQNQTCQDCVGQLHQHHDHFHQDGCMELFQKKNTECNSELTVMRSSMHTFFMLWY